MNRLLKRLSLLVFILGWVLIGKIARASEPVNHERNNVQVETIDLYDEERQRPVKITIWYPSGGNCANAAICLANYTKLDQGAVFSHGAMGAAKGYNWIGYALASKGIVTVGLNHYGESWVYGQEHIDPSAALRFWERPTDITFVLDQLTTNRLGSNGEKLIFSDTINWHNVTAIGHSSGGASVLALVGSQLAFDKAKPYCEQPTSAADKSCDYLDYITDIVKTEYKPEVSFKDKRIKRVIALDPALGHVTKQESLQSIKQPVLVIGSKQNDFLIFNAHAGYYAANIPAASTLTLEKGEGHFIYLDKCNHSYTAMGVSLCLDRKGVNRNAVHQRLLSKIFSFIYKNKE